MNILVTLCETSEWRQLVQQLPVINKADSIRSLTEQPVAAIARAETLDSFAAVINKNSAVTFILCYQNPLLQFAAALDAGEEIQPITVAWLRQVSELLKLQRRYRKQLKLLCLQSLASCDSSDFTDVAPEVQALSKLNIKLNFEQHSPVALLVASQLFNDNSELSSFKTRLDASSLQLSGCENPADAVHCWQAFKEMQLRSQTEYKTLQQENTDALNQLYELQLNVEQQIKQQNELKHQVRLLHSDKVNIAQELSLAKQQLAAAAQLALSERQQRDAEQNQAEQSLIALNMQLKEISSELTQLKDKFVEAQRLLEDKSNQAKQLEQQLQQTQQQQVVESQQAAQLQAQLKQQLGEKLQNIQKLEVEKQELKESYATLLQTQQQEQREYTAQLGNTLEQLNMVTEALAAAKLEIDTHTASLEQALVQNEKLEQQVDKASKHYQQQVAELNEQAINLQQAFENEKLRYSKSEVLCEQLTEENTALVQQLMQVQERVEHFYIHNKSAQQQLEQTKAELDANKAALVNLELQKAEMLKQQLQQLQQQHQAELKQKEHINTGLLNEVTGLRVSHTKLQQQVILVQQRLQQAESDKQRQHTQHLQELKPLQREYAKLEKQFKLQRAELAGYKHQYQQLKAELSKIKDSTSWKAAAPLRVISKKLKKTDQAKERMLQDVGLIFTSEYFDADWYLETYPDLKEAGVNPAEHYLKYGAKEGRRPSAEFDGNWYLKRYPDVAESGVNPLLHYIKFGRNEGRTASPKLLADHSEHN